jgi:succinate-semialdehyde dehydrogenase / glutarate-semialdehyde dehydrogenase
MDRKKLYLNGKWVGSDEAITVMNPATEETIAEVASVGRDVVRKTLDDAQAAFKGWRELPARTRGDAAAK